MTLQRISFWLVWVFIFTVPWESLLLLSSHTPVSTLTGIVAICAAAIQIVARGTVRLSRLQGALAGFVMLSGLSLLWSIDLPASVTMLITLCALMAVSVATYDSVRDKRDVQLLMLAYVLGCLVSVVGGLQSFAANASYARSQGRFVVDGFDPNDMAVALAIGIPFCIYLALVARRMWKLVFTAGVGALLVGIGLTGSRGGAIAGAFGLISLAALFVNRMSLSKKLIIAVLLVACVVSASKFVSLPAVNRILTIGDEMNGGDFDGRKQIWAGGVVQFSVTPILGVGSGAFPAAMSQRVGEYCVAHNSYLTMCVELGIAGVLLMLLIAAITLSDFRLLPGIERWIWFGALTAWGTGVFSLTWGYRKPTWVLATLFAAHCAVVAQDRVKGVRSTVSFAVM